MDRKDTILIFLGLALSLFLVVFISPFASPQPDGLEKVAEQKGFLERGEGRTLWRSSPLPDYTAPVIKNKSLATGMSRLIGTLGIFLIAIGVARLVASRSKTKNQEKGNETRLPG